MASQAQVNYIKNLGEKKQFPNEEDEKAFYAYVNTPGYLDNLKNQEVNEILDWLKAMPWKPRNIDPGKTYYKGHPDLPATSAENTRQVSTGKPVSLSEQVDKGRYFIIDPHDGEEKFVIVSKPEPPSRWAGYTFVNVQASDYEYPVKDPAHREAIFKGILEFKSPEGSGPIASMNEYGIRLGVCGVCGRTLTARDSRLRGIGPICAAKLEFQDGQATPDQIDILNKLGLIK